MRKSSTMHTDTYATFETNINLQETYCDWNRNNPMTLWAKMKQHFSTKIQMNKNDPSVMQRQQQANEVIDQAKEQE